MHRSMPKLPFPVRARRAPARAAFLVVLGFLPGVCLQDAASAPQISVQVDVVTLPVTVTGARGQFVGGLKPGNFRLRVDGAERPIAYFTPEQTPAQVLILVETGPAVYLLSREHIAAAAALLGGLDAGDAIAVASYSDVLRLLLDFTGDRQQAAGALGAMSYNLGNAQLNFYASLANAVDWVAAKGDKRAIVVLTTGLDSAPAGPWEVLAQKLQHSNVLVLPVALGGELRDDKRKSAQSAPDGTLSFAESDRALEAIAAETGGFAFFPRSARDFTEAYQRIGSLLGHSYSLGFAAQERDGRYHSVQVEVVDDQGRAFNGKDRKPEYRVNTRRGFLAAPPQQP
jgi:Ca-activated chloride channel family protein